MTPFQKAQISADYIKSLVTDTAEVGIVLGSGLSSFTNYLEGVVRIPYDSIPHFPEVTVDGHSGELIFGKLNEVKLWAMSGRFHYYEGYELAETVFPLRVLKLLGLKRLIVSNAAGGLNQEFQPGDIMLIEDQIDMFPANPLRGKHEEAFGPRFPDMSEPFDLAWRGKTEKAAQKNGITIQKGVYLGTQGPKLESKAEIRFFKIIGGDAVGMSTVPEVIAARQMGIKILGFSVITNQCLPNDPREFTHEEVVEVANLAGERLVRIVKEIL